MTGDVLRYRVCGREIGKEDCKQYDGMCWECWDNQLTEESDSIFGDLMQEDICLWPCKYCGHENDESSDMCENCGSLREDSDQSGDYGGAGSSDFGGDPLWDDDQGLMQL